MKNLWNALKAKIPVSVIVSFVLGVVVGLVVLGWWLWPVKYINADIAALRERHQMSWVQMVADSFAVTGDLNQAKARLRELESKDRSAEDVGALIAQVAAQAGNADEAGRVQTLANAVGLQAAAPTAGPTAVPAAAEPAETSGGSRWRLCLIPVFILLIVAGAALIYFWIRRRASSARLPRRRVVPSGMDLDREAAFSSEEVSTEEGEEPVEGENWPAESIPWDVGGENLSLGHFVTTFELGDDGYDESFGIETETGEFLGECGVAISEVIGSGTEKPCAFDVWLFDKSDIRTVTTVVASPYAYEDDTLRTKLGAKGNLILAEKGQTITIETAALQVQAEVVDLDYGGGELPAESYFTKFTLELSPSRKRPE